MDFTAETLERAVCQFYQIDSSAQAEAHHYLTTAKSSLQAWAFVWDLLQPHKPTEVQFYGATTLHTKIEKSLTELSEDQILQLRQRLLTAIVTYGSGPKIVLNRLCISLSAYLLHTIPNQWGDAIPELLNTITPEQIPQVPASRVIWVLLEVLTLIPEEFACMHFTSYRKGLLRNELETHSNQVLLLLESILTGPPDEDITVQAIKCVGAWSTLGIKFPRAQSLVNILIALIFNYHQHPSGICEKALETLGLIVAHPITKNYPTYLLDILVKILPLREIVARELTLDDQADQGLVRDIYTLLISFGETHSQLLLQWIKEGGTSRDHVMGLVTALLHCSGAQGSYPIDESYSRLAFGFWYMLQDQIIACSEEQEYQLCMKLLGPIYQQLVNVLLSKAQLPSARPGMSREDAESFRCYRQDIGDTMMYCYSILHETTLSIIKTRLEKLNVEDTSWQELEACLFGLCSIAENVDLEETTYLPTLFQYIRQLPFDRLNYKVLSTALDTVGAYAEWIAANSAVLEHVLPLIPLGLNVGDVAPNATMALKDLTRDCHASIKPYCSLILDASQNALHSGRLNLSEGVRLMFSVGRLLSMLPSDSLFPSLEVIATPYFEQLSTLSRQEPNAAVKSNILTCLKMLGTLTHALERRIDSQENGGDIPSTPHPALLILHKLLPILKVVAATWGSDSSVMQAIYAALKHSVSTLLDDSEPAIGDILELMVSSYRVCPEPGALELARQLCILFGKEEKCVLVMQSLVGELCSVTMTTVASAPSFSEHTELLQEFFILLSHIVKKTPQILVFGTNESCVPLVQCGTLTLGVPELPTVKAATTFLVNFVTQSRELPSLSNVVNMCGEHLVHKLIALIGGDAPRSNIEPLADILLALNKKYCDNHARWLHQAVNETACGRATPQQRDTFVKTVLRECSNKRKLQEHVREFSLVCRGLISTSVTTTYIGNLERLVDSYPLSQSAIDFSLE